jgi:hypothetical protein
MPTLKATPRLSPTFPATLHRVVPDPEGLTWQDWVDTAVGMNGRLGLPHLVDVNAPWQAFADQLALVVPDTPYGEDFETWQDWVRALRSALVL